MGFPKEGSYCSQMSTRISIIMGPFVVAVPSVWLRSPTSAQVSIASAAERSGAVEAGRVGDGS